MMAVAAVLGGLGLVCIMVRRTLLGLLIGTQILILGATTVFVLAGVSSGAYAEGLIFGLFITFGGIAQLITGYAFAVRLFYLRKSTEMVELRSLKH
jgi:NADH:ubiquinone oxidoreductase subunit K